MYKYLMILGFSTALVLPAQAFSHEEVTENVQFQKVGSFGDVDANEDGIITEAEYLSFDGEGARSDEDWRKNHWAEMIEKFDGNSDNQLEMQEIIDFADRTVTVVMEKLHDKHGEWVENFEFNGEEFEFDGEEFEMKFKEKMAGVDKHVFKIIKRLHEDGEFPGNFEFELDGLGDLHAFAFAAPHGFMFHSPEGSGLKDLDSDEDGAISREEFNRGRQELFDRLDENGDGVLDQDELKNFSWIGNFAFSWHNSEEDEE